MNRGDVYVAAPPDGRRPVVVVTRDTAIPLLGNVTVAMVTTTQRGLLTEVPLGEAQGLAWDCCANCDNLSTIPKTRLVRRLGSLGPAELRRLDDALRIALGLA